MSNNIENLCNSKAKNSKHVYNLIRKHGNITKMQLKGLTGLKLSTLVRTINNLMSDNLIQADNIGESTGGRRPTLYSVNPGVGYIVGIDISRTYTRVALLDLNCNILKNNVFGMFENSTPSNTLDKICSIISEYTKELGSKSIMGIGVGVVGPFDRKKGIMLNPVNFPAVGWENVSIKKSLEEKTCLLTVVDNGANAAAIGEYRNGTGKGYNDVVYIISGIGIRSGLIANGRLVSNSNNSEGAFGHMIVDIDGVTCSCGNQGCLEAYASISPILNEFITELKKGKHSIALEKVDFDLSSINIDALCKAVELNDLLAVEIIHKAAGYYAAGLANIINILSPDLVILGGPLVRKCDLFYQLSTELAIKKISSFSSAEVKFSKGILKESAVVVGAANLVLDHFLQ